MKYIVQLLLVLIAFYAASRVKRNARNALITKTVDWGIHKLNPVTGEKAVRLAKIAIIWADICLWGIVVIFFLYNLLDWIR